MFKQMRLLVLSAALLTISGCATFSKTATPQERFDAACSFLRGASATAQPFMPIIATKIGTDGVKAIDGARAAIATTCGAPLDVTKADAIIQRVWDTAGEVLAAVAKAQAP